MYRRCIFLCTSHTIISTKSYIFSISKSIIYKRKQELEGKERNNQILFFLFFIEGLLSPFLISSLCIFFIFLFLFFTFYVIKVWKEPNLISWNIITYKHLYFQQCFLDIIYLSIDLVKRIFKNSNEFTRSLNFFFYPKPCS